MSFRYADIDNRVRRSFKCEVACVRGAGAAGKPRSSYCVWRCDTSKSFAQLTGRFAGISVPIRNGSR